MIAARRLLASAAPARRALSIDVHSHCYLPRYVDMLRDRAEVPRVVPVGGEDRLLILPDEEKELSTASGRPMPDLYYSMDEKLRFMDMHDIDITVLSLANPWLEFLDAAEAVPLAEALNEDLQGWCEQSGGRIYGFGTLPTQDVEAAVAECERIARLGKLRGVILGTGGLGAGLDDPALRPLWAAIERLGLTVFLHPHYGVGTEHFGGTGHSLFLAEGFTFETTVAVSRLVLAGVLEDFPELKLLLAHAGGTLPFLAGRLDSCVKHDEDVCDRLPHPPSHYLRRLYYDSIVYHTPALQCTIDFVGADRVMFGTDNPFFPPPQGADPKTTPWVSTTANYDAIDGLEDAAVKEAILEGNARRLLGL